MTLNVSQSQPSVQTLGSSTNASSEGSLEPKALMENFGPDAHGQAPVGSFAFYSEMLADLKQSVIKLRATAPAVYESLQKAGVEKSIAATKKTLDQINAQHKSGFLGSLEKVLKPIGIAVSAIAVLVNPNPLTIALFSFTVGSYVDHAISGALGTKSLMSRFTGALNFKFIHNDTLKSILSSVSAALVVVGSVYALVRGSGGAQAFKNLDFVKNLVRKINENPQISQRIMDSVNAMSTLEQSGLQVSQQFFAFKSADAQHDVMTLSAQKTRIEEGQSMVDDFISMLGQQLSNINHAEQSTVG